MKKTHKKMLGSLGLGLVVATTIAAAVLPYPAASAIVGGVADKIQVTVLTGNPDLVAVSTGESEITAPEYSFSVTYNRLTSAKAVLVNYDADGNVKFTAEIWNEALDQMPGSRDFNLNLDDYGGKGYFTITVSGTGDDGVELEQILSVAYTSGSKESDADPDSGNADVDIKIPTDKVDKVIVKVYDEDGNLVDTIPIDNPSETETIDLGHLPNGDYTLVIESYNKDGDLINTNTINVTKTDNDYRFDIHIDLAIDSVVTIETSIYDADGNIVRTLEVDRGTGRVDVFDANGNLLFSVENGYKNGRLTIPMEGLPYGDYTGLITFRDANGKLVGGTIKVIIRYYGKTIIVPDTGSFFQGLNISREDYLITGLIVFMIIGVVAFGVMKRNRKTNHQTKVNGKNRR